jgi:CheY-like chemotaxis protein/nitrogen-specific signal transduction histidine kinase
MGVMLAEDIANLQDSLALSRKDLRLRMVGIAAIMLGFLPLVGWTVALIWGLASLIMAVGAGALLGGWARRRLSPDRWLLLAVAYIAVSYSVMGSLGLAASMTSGPWGLVNAECLMFCLVVYASRAGARSALVFYAAMAPVALYMAVMAVLAFVEHAPWKSALCLAMGTVFFLVNADQFSRWSREKTIGLDLARRRAEAATAAKSAFVAMVSHELRTPISGILAGAAELETAAADTTGRANAALITDSGRMMRTLLNDLLDLSKIEAGRMTVESTEFDLRRTLVGAVRFWRPETRRRGLKLRVHGARAIPQWVKGDPTRIRQIINNLVSNALKFTDRGTVTLSVWTIPIEGGGFLFRLEVIDTGPGMEQGQLDRLFGAFDQLEPSTVRTHGGTGLGLHISRELARMMGGDLTADSAPGRGALFRLITPMEFARPVDQTSRPVQAPEPEPALGLRVLVADDHHVNRQAFSLMLQGICTEVRCVEDGQEALDVLATAPFDLVLMDLNMPRLGGLEAVRRLRAGGGSNRRTPVIALTASVTAGDVDACLEAGMDAFVMKPVEARELMAAIDQVLSAGAAESAPSLEKAG